MNVNQTIRELYNAISQSPIEHVRRLDDGRYQLTIDTTTGPRTIEGTPTDLRGRVL